MLEQRRNQFYQREIQIVQVAERLLLENQDAGLTLDMVAQELKIAKGTLYKHFKSKDELYMLLLLRHEQLLLQMVEIYEKKDFNDYLTCFMRHHLDYSERTILFHTLEEKLSLSRRGLQPLFAKVYQIRRQRLKKMVITAENYLKQKNSHLTVRDYLAMLWALSYGAALLLNSSFYQRYLGSRETLKKSYIQQAIHLLDT